MSGVEIASDLPRTSLPPGLWLPFACPHLILYLPTHLSTPRPLKFHRPLLVHLLFTVRVHQSRSLLRRSHISHLPSLLFPHNKAPTFRTTWNGHCLQAAAFSLPRRRCRLFLISAVVQVCPCRSAWACHRRQAATFNLPASGVSEPPVVSLLLSHERLSTDRFELPRGQGFVLYLWPPRDRTPRQLFGFRPAPFLPDPVCAALRLRLLSNADERIATTEPPVKLFARRLLLVCRIISRIHVLRLDAPTAAAAPAAAAATTAPGAADVPTSAQTPSHPRLRALSASQDQVRSKHAMLKLCQGKATPITASLSLTTPPTQILTDAMSRPASHAPQAPRHQPASVVARTKISKNASPDVKSSCNSTPAAALLPSLPASRRIQARMRQQVSPSKNPTPLPPRLPPSRARPSSPPSSSSRKMAGPVSWTVTF